MSCSYLIQKISLHLFNTFLHCVQSPYSSHSDVELVELFQQDYYCVSFLVD
jgi:hypothetical protein